MTYREHILRSMPEKHRIANAGDQVPPGAEEDRIKIIRGLAEEYGQY